MLSALYIPAKLVNVGEGLKASRVIKALVVQMWCSALCLVCRTVAAIRQAARERNNT